MILYNEIEPYCVRWLEHLVSAGDIPNGIVRNVPVLHLAYERLQEFRTVHFFAGIGGWAKALSIADWPAELPVWTGSCPCQPFSISSQRRLDVSDDRHEWPNWFELIKLHRPSTIFGEQVAGGGGKNWLVGVKTDLESLGYKFAAITLPAACVGAKHRRERIFFVADTCCKRLSRFEPNKQQSVCLGVPSAPTQFDYSIFRERFQVEPSPISTMSFDGISRPVGIVRAFGNSLVPQVAALFVRSFMEAIL